MGVCGDIRKQLAGIDEVAFGLDGVALKSRCDGDVVQHRIVNPCVTTLDVGRKVFACETIEKRTQYVLFEVPAVDRASDFVGDLPDSAL
jgi:hypothetical protein